MRLALCCLLTLLLGACAQTPRAVDDAPAPLPSAEDAVRAHNERVARLDRLWARAIVTIRFTDERGERKWEQGDGHFQLKDASKLALSIGKVGEVLVWIGANDKRFWIIDRLNDDETLLFVGRHDATTRGEFQRAGLPVPPKQLLRLGALRPIDAADAHVSPEAEGRLAVTVPDADGAWRYVFEPAPDDDMPLVVQRLNADGGVLLESSLEQPKLVDMNDGRGGWPPRMFSRLLVTHVPTGDSISLLLDGEITDGRRRGVPNDAVFDLDVLTNAYGPIDRVVELGESEPG
ncbi:MAG: hypothetical protein Tsb0013_13850 [Phycisphaerales bacterium]